jgi:AcrR family transcriptional regulator
MAWATSQEVRSVSSWLYPKLRPGPGRATDEVLASQRARLRTAMVELCAERGYEHVTVRALARLAGVSTRTFYRHFTNVEDCFAATYESLIRGALRRARAAKDQNGGREEGLRASLRLLLRDVVDRPKEARLVLNEAFAAGPAMHPWMREAVGGFEQLLLDGLLVAPDEVAASELIARGVVAGAMRVARNRLLAGHAAELEALDRQLGDWMLGVWAERPFDLEPSDRPPLLLSPNRGRQAEDGGEEPTAALLGAPGDGNGRILAAAAKLAAVDGYSSLTIPGIRAEAGVSRRHLDARFADAADCFLAAVEALAAVASSRAAEQAAEATSWEDRVRRYVDVLCVEGAAHPDLARLVLVEIFAPSRKGLECKRRLLSSAAAWLRASSPSAQQPSELVAEASVAAAWGIAHADVEAGRAKRLPNLAPLLAGVLLASTASTAAYGKGRTN